MTAHLRAMITVLLLAWFRQVPFWIGNPLAPQEH
jgi:hypothetical protein